MLAIEEPILRDGMLVRSTVSDKKPMALLISRLLPWSLDSSIGEKGKRCAASRRPLIVDANAALRRESYQRDIERIALLQDQPKLVSNADRKTAPCCMR